MTHPALQAAMDGCARLAEAAGIVGSPDPVDAIRQIDYDPQAVDAYVQQVRTAAADLDKAIDEQQKAIAEHESSTEGSASDSAHAAMTKELSELRDERARLEALIQELQKIATRMDELARSASDRILGIARQADPAVGVVLDGSWQDDPDGAAAEDAVHRAVAEIINVCLATQDQVAALRSELNAAMDAAEAQSGGSNGAQGGGEAAQGGGEAAQGGQAEGGTGEAGAGSTSGPGQGGQPR